MGLLTFSFCHNFLWYGSFTIIIILEVLTGVRVEHYQVILGQNEAK